MITDDLSAYAADAAAPVIEGEDRLAVITRLARELRDAKEHLTELDQHHKDAAARVKALEEGDLPEAMRAAGQVKCRTTDGYDLTLGETLRASIPPVNLPQAVMWLDAHGQGAIIKRDIGLKFGKGEDQQAAHALDAITSAGFKPSDKQSVHPQTLAAVIREMLAEGVEVPMDLLGAFVQPHVKMTQAK